MAPDQQTPPTNSQQTPTVDDLISHANHQAYSFHAAKSKPSMKMWLMDLPRTKKIIGIACGASLIFVILMVSLTLHMGSKGNLSSTLKQASGTTATSMSTSDGADQASASTSLEGDTNGDGVVDENDTADTSTDTTTPSDEDLSWWQQLLSVVSNRDTSTNSSSASSSSSSPNASTTDGGSSAAAVAVQETSEDNQEEQQTSTAPAVTPSAPQTPATPTPTTATPTPTLSSSITNFRDAAATSSGLMKSGVLFRSAKLQNATAGDRSKLATLLKNGVIVDLRTSSVRKGSPDKTVTDVTNINYPVNAPDGTKGDNRYVGEFVNNATDRGHFGEAITKIANAKGSVLVHCTAGKDRTGWMVAMTMYAIGATDKQVMDEYMRSQDFGAEVNQAWLNNAIKAAKAQNGGSIIKYIKSTTKGLGVSDATIQKLKSKLHL